MDNDSKATDGSTTAQATQIEHNGSGLSSLAAKYAKKTGYVTPKPDETFRPRWYLSNTSGKASVPIDDRVKVG